MFPNKISTISKHILRKNDHPELDNTELCNEDSITQFMCMIGQLQCTVTLGRYDILAYAVHIQVQVGTQDWTAREAE